MPKVLAGGEANLPDVTSLTALMETPSPPRDLVTAKAAAALAELRQARDVWLKHEWTSKDLHSLVDRALKRSEASQELSWEVAEQLFLALEATRKDPKLDERRRELWEIRAWPRGFSSAKDFEPARFRTLLDD